MDLIISVATSLAIPAVATYAFYQFVVKGLLARQKADYAEQLEKQKSEHLIALEKFKQEGQAELSNRRSNHELSVAALEKRLEVHQQAYSLWVDMKNHPAGNSLEIYGNCLAFLKDNAIYLTSSALSAFTLASNLLNECYIAERAGSLTVLTAHLRKLEEQGDIIREALNLPDINVWKEE